jgi:hypothetical protein
MRIKHTFVFYRNEALNTTVLAAGPFAAVSMGLSVCLSELANGPFVCGGLEEPLRSAGARSAPKVGREVCPDNACDMLRTDAREDDCDLANNEWMMLVSSCTPVRC